MPNGEVCCLLQVCCPPEVARRTMAEKMMHKWDIDPKAARACADWLYDHFQLLPAGTIDLPRIVDAATHK
jgi:hypothetical protein